jgi:hypothetical protein
MMPTRPKTTIIIGDSREMSDRNMLEYDEDKWLNGALIFTRDKSEIPEYDPSKGPSPIPRPRFVDISVKDINSHWFRFQSAAKKQLSTVIGMIEAL